MTISLNLQAFSRYERFIPALICLVLIILSLTSFAHYSQNGLALAYNDARSHLNIGRRVVEGLKPGLAQVGSVWLPLTHLLMVPTVWNDWMWHTGLAGALQSMVAYVATGLIIYSYLKQLRVGLVGRLVGVGLFALNLNLLYLQSTAMTELLLLATMTAGCYQLLRWYQTNETTYVIKAAFWIMLSTLIRYDGWFLLLAVTGLILLRTLFNRGYKVAEGLIILFLSLGAFGIVLWFGWNLLIFKDPLYFAFGPFSAHAQQDQLAAAGVLASKHNLLLSIRIYFYALIYNSYTPFALLAALGGAIFFLDRHLPTGWRVAALALLTPLVFNIIALYFGHSVLFVQGISGNTWFNVRYGTMLIPSIAISVGYLVHRLAKLKLVLIGLICFYTFFSLTSKDAVTIDDALYGSSQKNVSEVSGWLNQHVPATRGFVLISAASHDAIIFSSGLPMSRFIHEGTGLYWQAATTVPDRWARWIIMRTHDSNDLAWKLVASTPGFPRYNLVASYPFADIYELKPEYLPLLNTDPIFPSQR